MPTLTQDELTQLAQALNDPSAVVDPQLLNKLNPDFFAEMVTNANPDLAVLFKEKYPVLQYAGKRKVREILASAALVGMAGPLQVLREFGAPAAVGWRNLIVQGDNLQFLKTCYLNKDPLIKDKVKGKVKLVYIDPPFATKSDFGGDDGEDSYTDKIVRSEFIEGLRERLLFCKELLSSDASIYLHLDQKMGHYMKVVMDELFGKNNYKNEIVWHYQTGGIPEHFYAQKHDTLLFYGFGNYTFNTEDLGVRRDQCDKCEQTLTKPNNMKKGVDSAGRIYRSIMSAGKEYRYYDDEIVSPTDVWLNINQLQQKDPERTNASSYPSQKPENLLYRVIKASTNVDDLVIDLFAGSGTTAAVAEKLGRRWIVCDFGKHASYTMQKRLLDIGNSKKLGKDANGQKYGNPPKALAVASVGAYDYSRILDLKKNSDLYIDFVLSLFGYARSSEDLTQTFVVPNVYALHGGYPVEVYPIWDDVYLKDIKVDLDYLQSIADSLGTQVKDEYTIIVPAICCSVLGDQEIEANGKIVTFRIKHFPYKILEEVNRQIATKFAEQPASEKQINELVSSVGLYFNHQVDIDVIKTDNGLKIESFATEIVTPEGKVIRNFDALSMVLVDLEYDGSVFAIDIALYADKLNDDFAKVLAGVTDKTAVIGIDKFGNESPVTLITD